MKNFGVSRSGTLGVRYWELELFRGTGLNADSLKEFHESEAVQKMITVPVPGGRIVDLEILGNVYPEGERRAIQLNIRDVTDRRKVEEAWRGSSAGQPPRRAEAIGRLAGSVAEDFSKLLGTVSTYKEALKQGGGDGPKSGESGEVAEIGRTLERAGMLARQLMMLGGRREFRPETLNLNDVLANVEPIVRTALAASIELRVQQAPDLKAVSADRGQLEHLILNLALNAQESLPGGGSLTVHTYNMTVDDAYTREHPAVKPGAYVVLEVSDSGILNYEAKDGAEQAIPRGLSDVATTASIIRQFGGYVWAASEFGRGTTFRIFLPQV